MSTPEGLSSRSLNRICTAPEKLENKNHAHQSIHPLVQADEVGPSNPEFFKRVYELPETARETVVALDNRCMCKAM
jgi:hypothetical protein